MRWLLLALRWFSTCLWRVVIWGTRLCFFGRRSRERDWAYASLHLQNERFPPGLRVLLHTLLVVAGTHSRQAPHTPSFHTAENCYSSKGGGHRMEDRLDWAEDPRLARRSPAAQQDLRMPGCGAFLQVLQEALRQRSEELHGVDVIPQENELRIRFPRTRCVARTRRWKIVSIGLSTHVLPDVAALEFCHHRVKMHPHNTWFKRGGRILRTAPYAKRTTAKHATGSLRDRYGIATGSLRDRYGIAPSPYLIKYHAISLMK